MELLLVVLGIFGVLPVLCMTVLYTVVPLVLIGLQVLGAVEGIREGLASEAPAVPAQLREIDRAA